MEASAALKVTQKLAAPLDNVTLLPDKGVPVPVLLVSIVARCFAAAELDGVAQARNRHSLRVEGYDLDLHRDADRRG